jgi:hypothetical protein
VSKTHGTKEQLIAAGKRYLRDFVLLIILFFVTPDAWAWTVVITVFLLYPGMPVQHHLPPMWWKQRELAITVDGKRIDIIERDRP